MSSVKLSSTAGGSLKLQADQASTVDEVIVPAGRDEVLGGVGYEYVNIGSAFGAIRTNTSGSPELHFLVIGADIAQGRYELFVNGTTVTGVQTLYSNTITTTFVVQAGGTYNFNGFAGGCSVRSWFAQRKVTP